MNTCRSYDNTTSRTFSHINTGVIVKLVIVREVYTHNVHLVN